MHTITAHIVVRDAGAAAKWYAEALGAEEQGRIESRGYPQLDSRRGIVETGRHDAHDHPVDAVQRNHPPENLWIAAKFVLPQQVAEND